MDRTDAIEMEGYYVGRLACGLRTLLEVIRYMDSSSSMLS